MVDPKQPISPEAISAAGLDDWRVIDGVLCALFHTGDFAGGARLTGQIAVVADELNHHPDVDLRYPHLTVRTISHDVSALTSRDVELARRISTLAAEAGAAPGPGEVTGPG
ncbi:MAG TPA: 4a-hydroxytetrahydrobiopterin dehydratase [Beutenbergiaceae bacterium]|nr:4a-hydroxytetrahydrobiopterin dehydratase [Beutenbergiaceae bacterium]